MDNSCPAAAPTLGLAAVAAGWMPAAAAAAAGAAAGVLPKANAAATPAIAVGAAAIGSRRLTVLLVELPVLPKGLLPAEFALTGKAACTVHW
jgi:hypothetical protein